MALDDDDPVEVYRRELANVLPLTKEEAAHLFQEARQSGDQGEPAKRRLIESHLHLWNGRSMRTAPQLAGTGKAHVQARRSS